jgi:hypothetical protein
MWLLRRTVIFSKNSNTPFTMNRQLGTKVCALRAGLMAWSKSAMVHTRSVSAHLVGVMV